MRIVVLVFSVGFAWDVCPRSHSVTRNVGEHALLQSRKAQGTSVPLVEAEFQAHDAAPLDNSDEKSERRALDDAALIRKVYDDAARQAQEVKVLDLVDMLFSDEDTDSVKMNPSDALGLTFDHLPKAGGSFVKAVIKEAVPENEICIRSEFGHLRLSDQARFTIGGIRNPCEYYVSLYSFGAEGKGSFHDFVPASLYKRNSPGHFRRWLNYIMPGPIGLLSYRFAKSYGIAEVPKQFPGKQISPTVAQLLNDSITAFPTSTIDCWIKTESLVDDLANCLGKYESIGGNVSWTKFHHTISNASHNPSDHLACSEFFDDDARALVSKVDSQLFAKFGYSHCCEN